MKSPTANRIKKAAHQCGNAVQDLRDSLKVANGLQGDCIGELIRESADLQRRIARLAQVIELDAE